MWLCPDHGGRLTGAPDVPSGRRPPRLCSRGGRGGCRGTAGEVFDAVAEAYDRERPSYPDELIDAACSIAALRAGSRVLEVGCGTGKLTEALAERGLVVDAVDPGANMIAFARKRVRDCRHRQFHLGRFEEVPLPEQVFDAVFSAAAFHWIDPEIGWAKAARCLRPGGTLALIMHISYREERTAETTKRCMRCSRSIGSTRSAGIPSATWPPSRRCRGAPRKRLRCLDLARPPRPLQRRRRTPLRRRPADDPAARPGADRRRAVGALRDDVALPAPRSVEPRALETEVRAFFEERGGKIQTSELVVLVTARDPDQTPRQLVVPPRHHELLEGGIIANRVEIRILLRVLAELLGELDRLPQVLDRLCRRPVRLSRQARLKNSSPYCGASATTSRSCAATSAWSPASYCLRSGYHSSQPTACTACLSSRRPRHRGSRLLGERGPLTPGGTKTRCRRAPLGARRRARRRPVRG